MGTANSSHPHAAPHGRSVSDAGAALRGAGLRVTPQRRAVLTMVLAGGSHWSADEIWQRLSPAEEAVLDRSTVYRVLADLDAAGLISQVRLGDGVARFEPKTDAHLHLLCTECKTTKHISAEHLLIAATSIAMREGFDLAEGSLLLSGVCARCRVAGR